MTVVTEQCRPWKQARWKAFCQDAQALMLSSPCLLCGPQLAQTLVDPQPEPGAPGLHIDDWDRPGQPVRLWPLEALPYRAWTPLMAGHPYTTFALAVLLRALHHAGDRTLTLHVSADLSGPVLGAGVTLGRHFADQRNCEVRELRAGG